MRARNMQALTDDIEREYGPGVTIWGKGDAAHEGSTSDHNEDDTPGSRSEQADADNVPEHRAIDVALLGPFTMADARELRARLTDRPANRERLRYVILEQSIWRKRDGWVRKDYAGEYHGHLHASGDVANDGDADPWDIGPVVPQQVRRDRDMFLVHKKVGSVVTYALIGSAGADRIWRDTDVITTSEGLIGGQDLANAYARSIGDSRLEPALAWAALAGPVGA